MSTSASRELSCPPRGTVTALFLGMGCILIVWIVWIFGKAVSGINTDFPDQEVLSPDT